MHHQLVFVLYNKFCTYSRISEHKITKPNGHTGFAVWPFSAALLLDALNLGPLFSSNKILRFYIDRLAKNGGLTINDF